MKSIYLLFFSFVQLVLFSCSEQGVYVNNVSNQVIQKDIAITRAIIKIKDEKLVRKLAGEEGVEPSRAGIKTRCLNHLATPLRTADLNHAQS